MNATHLLVVEDDFHLRELIREYLQVYGHQISVAESGETFRQQLATHRFDLILLDLNLPDVDGLELLAELRKQSDVPVFIVSARMDEPSRIRGLELGADDYIVKPFSARELELRVRNTLRRNTATQTSCFTGWTLNAESFCMTHHDGRQEHLTKAEFTLLKLLVAAGGSLVPRDELFHQLEREAGVNSLETITSLIYRLRRKMGCNKDNNPIITQSGVGYRILLDKN
ncbi:response regulator transcription factor [Marinospirillum alkaliphilum]|uniref:Two-component system, OmpR family, torCAD operon response regulator TorR n=1 Tax=Marinospirillum alkaliphilum DSM 21637 TaxID=1122209 RepID=A0A1K1YTN7_9GAMM|nr:response regulator transcription factor [Marinospirillum alkaliphilum]SFX65370.1 two-component system, OmpR family, torCAD operon response regulator TorR [Marinospirillum alkaliphilum DSM 21637]